MRILLRPKEHYMMSGYLEWKPQGSSGNWYSLSRANIFPHNETFHKISDFFDSGKITQIIVEGEYDRVNKIMTIHEIVSGIL